MMPLRRPEPVAVEAMFRARFDGHCPACDLPIATGQTICRMSDGRYVHDYCAEDCTAT